LSRNIDSYVIRRNTATDTSHSAGSNVDRRTRARLDRVQRYVKSLPPPKGSLDKSKRQSVVLSKNPRIGESCFSYVQESWEPPLGSIDSSRRSRKRSTK